MSSYSRITPNGTRDLLFEECQARRFAENEFSGLFTKRGYLEVLTPGLEYFDLFNLPDVAIAQEEMYKSTDDHGRLIVFRPDSTLPIARMATARLQGQNLPIRLFYNQSVYRNRRSHSGRYNESAQMGIELLGTKGLRTDIEVITLAIEAIKRITPNFRFEIGNAQLFNVLSGRLPISVEERNALREMIEAKNYASLGAFLDNLEQTETVDAIRMLPRLFGGEEALVEAEKFCTDKETSVMLSNMKTLHSNLLELGLGSQIMVDLALVQRNDYYSGVVFSAYVEDYGDAILFGGRYDNLLDKFQMDMPAVGFSIDMDAIMSIILKQGNAKSTTNQKILVHGLSGYELMAQVYIKKRLENEIDNGETSALVIENSVCTDLEEAKVHGTSTGCTELVVISDTIEIIPLGAAT